VITVTGEGIVVWDRGALTSEPAWMAEERRQADGQRLCYPQTGPMFTAKLTPARNAVWIARALWPDRATTDVEIDPPPGYENVPGRVY